MQENNMPAAEAGSDTSSYELAFHVLPTVAEGEVTEVFTALKQHITKAGGSITDEEAPERFDLAYEIVKYLEGRNRKFSSAYFGWVRFTLESEKLEDVATAVEETKELLRHLLIKLTKVEEENPFRFHETMAEKRVENVEAEQDIESDDKDSDSDEAPEDTEKKDEDDGADTEEEV